MSSGELTERERKRAGLREEVTREQQALDRLIDEAERWRQAKAIRKLECSGGKPRMQNCSNSGNPVRWRSRAKLGNGKV